MKIIIAGAGGIGFHLAKLLALENQDIILIDTNQEVLDYTASHLDVKTILGDSSSLKILEEAGAAKANLVLAMTTYEKNNLMTAILAKKMGAKQTIARVNNYEYLAADQRESFSELGVDTLISPDTLAAKEIDRLMEQCSLTDFFDFEKGKMSLIGITLDDSSPLVQQTIKEVSQKYRDILFRFIAIQRGHETVIPQAGTILRRGDHIYLVANKEQLDELIKMVGKKAPKVERVMIVGGGDIGMRTAQLLENKYHVTIVEEDKALCRQLIKNLHNSLVVKGNPGNIELLKEEGLSKMEAFIAVTPNSETNIITSLMAEEYGVYKTIALVDNIDYVHISQNIGVDTIINKKLIAANNIFRFVRKGKIEAITSLHGVDAEIIEFVIHKENRLTRKPLSELHFPAKAIVGGVIRGEETIIPEGDFIFQIDDKAIVFAQGEAISKVEKLFR